MIVGIDLGTTNSLIGAMDAGFPVLFADRDGRRLTPSVVHFPADGGPIVGHPAVRVRNLHPQSTVCSIKRFMGARRAESPADEEGVPYRLTGNPGEPIGVDIHGVTKSPEEISACILRKLKADAETALGRTVGRAVITVPAYFNDAQRNATKRAGELAGFAVERIVNEPTAAALAYGLDKLNERAKIAVFDLGGGTFDISILELHDGVFEVLSTCGNTRLGGDDIDRALAAHLAENLGLPENPDPQLAARLREAAIHAKHTLSTRDSTRVEIPFAHGAASPACELTRTELERVAAPIVERARPNCLRALADAGLDPSDLAHVLLVGGSTRMPLVRQFAARVFGREPDVSQHPDEAIAVGATIQAGVLSGAVQNVVLLDVTPLSLGIETFGGLMNVIIPRNTTIPTKAGEMFTNAVAAQSSMRISVLQGERELARDNWQLGRFDLPFDPAPKGRARVGVQFEIDANGILHVLARDTTSGRESVVTLKSAVDVSDDEVGRMIAESVDHAFDDMSQRILTEARLKAQEMLPAVQNALALVGGQLDDDERARIADRVRAVEEAMKSGAANQLKKATSALDDATQNLATLLVDRAMEEALRRKGAL